MTALFFSTLLPPFMLIAMGYCWARSSKDAPQYTQVLADFSFKIAVPALLFSSALDAKLPESIPWKLYIAFYGPMVLIFFTAVLFAYRSLSNEGADARHFAAFGMQAAYSNITILGIPIVSYFLGPSAMVPMILIIIAHDLILFVMGTLVAEFAAQSGRSMLRSLISLCASLITRPITAALIIGLAINGGGLQLPSSIEGGFQLLGQSGIPTALIVLGMKSVGVNIRGARRGLAPVLLFKLILFPALVGLLGFVLFELPYVQAATLLLAAAMPVGISALIFSGMYGVREKEAAASIVVSNAFFVALFFVLVVFLELVKPYLN